MGIGLDHLVAWHHLVMKGHTIPGFAYLSLMRTALECAVLTRWLCGAYDARGADRAWSRRSVDGLRRAAQARG